MSRANEKSGMNRNKKAQQEMIGFVLIVAVVIVAALVFIVISIRQPGQPLKSAEVDSLVSSILATTTDCAVTYVPRYDSVDQLIGSAYDNEQCSNLGKPATEYLNETLISIMDSVMGLESGNVVAYDIAIYTLEDDERGDVLFSRTSGNCSAGSKTLSGWALAATRADAQIETMLTLCYAE